MSGLYNMVLSQWPAHKGLLDELGMMQLQEDGSGIIDPRIPRYRDAYPVLQEGVWEIHVLTRAGGPNREDHEEGIAYLRSNPDYVGDCDEPYDTTYATFRFRIENPGLKKALEEAGEAASMPPFQKRWEQALAAIGERP